MGAKALARRQAELQGGKCFYCEGEMWIPSWEKKEDACRRLNIDMRTLSHREITREHLHRETDGGTRERTNMVAACGFCNTTRGSARPDDHKIRMMALAAQGKHPTSIIACPGEKLVQG